MRLTQSFVSMYNKTHKFMGQRMFKFNLYTFCDICLFWEDKIDVCPYVDNGYGVIFGKQKYSHSLAVKGFNKKHEKYLKNKYDLIYRLCKKYHVWSYNEHGRKCDGFDF